MDGLRTVIECVSDGVYVVDPSRQILLWNHGAERLTGHCAGEVEGKCCGQTLLAHVDDHGRPLCNGRCPLMATIKDGQPRQAHVFLRHRNGQRVAVNVQVRQLKDDQGNVIGGVETFSACGSSRGREARRCDVVGAADPLTGLATREAARPVLKELLAESRVFGLPLVGVRLEITNVTQLADAHGHAAADRLVLAVGNTLTEALPAASIVARWTSDVFVAVLADAAEQAPAEIASRLAAIVQATRADCGGTEISAEVDVHAHVIAPGSEIDGALAILDGEPPATAVLSAMAVDGDFVAV